MVKEILIRLFQNVSVLRKQNNFITIGYSNYHYLKLFAYYLHLTSSKNIILLSNTYLSPTLKCIELKAGQKNKLKELINFFIEFNYTKVEQIFNHRQYTQKGDTITVYTGINDLIYQINIWNDDIESLKLIDNVTMRPLKNYSNILLIEPIVSEAELSPVVIGDVDEFDPSVLIQNDNSKTIDTDIITLPFFHKNLKIYKDFIGQYKDYEFYYIGNNWELIPKEFKEKPQLNHLQIPVSLDYGFISKKTRMVILTDAELLSTLHLRKINSTLSSKFRKFFDNEVNINDFIVHEAHGIGKYLGIETKLVLGELNEYAVVEYANSDKLLIPLNQLDRISKYISADGSEPKLTTLGTAEWETVRRKLKKSVEDIAKELLELYAKKSMEKGIRFKEIEKKESQLHEDFKYELTEDQIRSINEVKNDMESSKPMDRLIIGDVGFGKTEIAIRASFKAFVNKYQVLVLAPTTVLVSQLYSVFSKRLSKFGIKIAKVSRFDGTKKNKLTIDQAKSNKIDILVGTHRLLSKDVNLKKLGLLIIDEEQRFGVKQKERLRKLRANIDVLSMSATPIPRTLQMALTGIKDISIIATPPQNRLPVKNEIIFKEEIYEKIVYEVSRGGQVFIIHNKIETIDSFANDLNENLNTSIRIGVGHGQMKGEKLEDIMIRFQEKQLDVLVATTIIENGIDIPTVNTIIINNAHQFGLSQLYQLRGRVGRSNIQGYCFLVVPKNKAFIKLHKNPKQKLKNLKQLLDENRIDDNWINSDAVARIEAILQNQELGAGFKIASRDLEIRGSGNILGSEQSGHINSVGYEMYIRLLEQEIERIRKLSLPNQ